MRKDFLFMNLIMISLFSLCHAEVRYTITDLGTLGGSESFAHSINDSGQVVGWSYIIPGDFDCHAFLYDGTTMNDLGTLGGSSSRANSINNRGQVVGYSYIVGDSLRHAFLYDGTTMHDIGTIGGHSSYAYGINDSGQVVGWSHIPEDSEDHAFLYDGTTMNDLGTLSGSGSSWAYSISDSGQVVGSSCFVDKSDDYHAFLLDGTTMQDLGTLGGRISESYDINESKLVVGYSNFDNTSNEHAFLYDGTTMNDLGTLGGRNSTAHSINDSGQIVGYSYIVGDSLRHAFLYEDGIMVDLNTLIPPNSNCILISAYDINNLGQIVGYGEIDGNRHAFLLNPIPECMHNNCNTRLAGTWSLRNLSTQKNEQSDNFGYDNGLFEFQSNTLFYGSKTDDMGVSWGENGSSQRAEDGSINLLFHNGNTVLNQVVNISRDIMAGNYEDDDEVGLNVWARTGENHSNADLEGTWYLRNLHVSRNGGADDFGYDSGTLTIQADGSLAGTFIDETESSWSATGSSSIDPNGIVTITIDGWVGDSWLNVMNAGKDVIIGNTQDNSSFFLNTFVKKGSSYTSADLSGTWYSRSLGTHLNSDPNDNFGYDTTVITIQEDGSFMLIETGTTSEENGGELFYSTGTAAIDPNGVVSLYVPSESFELNPVLSAGKDVMINNYLDPGNEMGIEIFLKKESMPGDLNFDGRVDMLDFSIFAGNWLEGV